MELVSVVIPSYNHARFVGEAIESVLAQSYRPLELVVVDDGSTDASPEVIRDALVPAAIPHQVFIEPENRGAHATIMRGIAAAGGRPLSILNSDDFYDRDRFARLVPHLAPGRDGLGFSGVRFVDDEGRVLPASNPWSTWYSRCLHATRACPTVGYALLRHNFRRRFSRRIPPSARSWRCGEPTSRFPRRQLAA